MSNTIWLAPNIRDGIGHQISELGRIIEKSKTCNEHVVIDYGNINFLHSTTILGISSLMTAFNKEGKTISFENINSDVSRYLSVIEFPHGIFPDLDPDWVSKIESYKYKTYLPIINFPTDMSQDSVVIRNSVLSKLNELIAHKLNLTLGGIAPISYLISELTDNIVEHSGVRRAKIVTQYYSTKGYIEICIIDEGKTIYGSYQENRKYIVDNDKTAIQFATQGKSTKSDERGFGIPTSIKLIVNGLEGKICLLSGSGMLVNEPIIDFAPRWGGTLLSLKIPRNFQNINYLDYV